MTALLMLSTSCVSIRTSYDYDTHTQFSKYKTFAFYKKGIDNAHISNLDKKRILRALEKELLAKGLTKSKNPDLLVSFFVKSKKCMIINSPYRNWDMSGPWYYGTRYHAYLSKYTEGTLFVDIIDTNKKELVWQGTGKGAGNLVKKEKRIQEFVAEIMSKYPPMESK